MAKKAMLQKLNPKPKGKVPKRKVQKLKPNMTLLARSESLTEREYTDGPKLKPLKEGTDRNMIKQEDIELETETMECDEVGQLPSNSVPITSEEESMDAQPLMEGTDLKMIKQEDIKLETETMECNEIVQLSSNSVYITLEETVKYEPVSFVVKEEVINPVPVNTTALIPARKQSKKEKLKLAKERDNIEKEQRKRQNKRTRNPARYEENIAQLPDYSEISLSLNQAVINNVEEMGLNSGFDIDSEANTGDGDVHNLHFPDTSMAIDTNQTVHSTIAESETNIGGKRYKCAHCSYASNHSGHFLDHSRIHTGEKPYQCNKCSFACARSYVLEKHMRIHTGKKPYQCNQCSHASAQLSSLISHVRTHTSKKPYKCPECSFTAAQAKNLKRHMRSHSGEKPYKCNKCSYASAETGNLKRHMLTHTGEKPYKCTKCSYAGASPNHLKTHILIHSGKRILCSQCSYACADSGNLKRHMRSHKGEKPYKCNQCSYAGGHPSNLKRHMQSHTRIV